MGLGTCSVQCSDIQTLEELLIILTTTLRLSTITAAPTVPGLSVQVLMAQTSTHPTAIVCILQAMAMLLHTIGAGHRKTLAHPHTLILIPDCTHTPIPACPPIYTCILNPSLKHAHPLACHPHSLLPHTPCHLPDPAHITPAVQLK